MKDYSKMGWREKLIFSFFAAFKNKSRFIEEIENDLHQDINGKQVKGYLLAMILFSDKDKESIFSHLLNDPKLFTSQKCWIQSALKHLNREKYPIEENCVRNDKKFDQALRIVKSQLPG